MEPILPGTCLPTPSLQSKSPHKKWVNPKSKKHKKKGKKAATKFDPKNPGAYVTSKVWESLSESQKEASRNARNEQGIKSRTASIRSMSTTQMEVEEIVDDDDDSQGEEEVEQAVSRFTQKQKDQKKKALPKVKVAKMTQRQTERPVAMFYIDENGKPISQK